MKKSMRILSVRPFVQVAVGISSLLVMTASAASLRWNSGDGNWGNSTQWAPTGVPGAGDTAQIDNTLNGTVTISDNQTAGIIYVGYINGYSGGYINRLTIDSGGNLTTTASGAGNESTLGYESLTHGIVTVNGIWQSAGALNIGYAGQGELIVGSGGSVTSVNATTVGYVAGAIGSVLVRGTLSNTGDAANGYFRVARYGTGMLTIGAGGVVNVREGDGALYLTHLGCATASGALNIGGKVNGQTPETAEAAGILNASKVIGHDTLGTSTLNFNHTSTDYYFTKNGTSSGSNIVISGAITTVHSYSGNTTLQAENTYGGGTTIHGGTLILTHGKAAGTGALELSGGTLHVNVNNGNGALANVGNTVSFTGNSATYVLERASGTAYSVYSASSNMSGGMDTTASLLAGAAGSARTLTTSFDTAPSVAATNDGLRASDVFSLTGTGTDIFVLELKMDNINIGYSLGWLNGSDTWVNAVDGNSATGGSAIAGYAGSFVSSGAAASAAYLGSWGYDTTADTVWAVLDHNSEFAVLVPEPSTCALLGLALGLSVFRRRGRRIEK